MSFVRTLGGLIAWLGLTALQFAILIALAVIGFGAAQALVDGPMRDDIATGAALFLPLLVGLSAEWWLKPTPLHWLRLSQNPVFSLPP